MGQASGYDRLARLMADDSEAAIFRKFEALSAENLLLLQAEIVDLETELRDLQKEDKESSDDERKLYSRDWFALKSSAVQDPNEGNGGQQWKTFLDLREKLDQYQRALLQHHNVAKLSQPSKRSVKSLDNWMQRPNMGDVRLVGRDRDIWSNPDMRDLVCLQDLEAQDLFTKWLLDYPIQYYHKLIGQHIHKVETESPLGRTVVYHNEKIAASVRIVATIIACMLPLMGILILYSVKDMEKRLGIIVGLTAIFTICMIGTTSANTKDIFSATAAFTAVLVVFVGTNN